MELASKEYWQDYYRDSSEDSRVISVICSKYNRFWEMLISGCQHRPKSILEIGAFPGRFLAYLSSRYDLKPTGIDFNPDVEKVRRTMESMGIHEYRYICSDLFDQKPIDEYDVVYSNGFIEHFTDFNRALDLHVDYLRPGGTLLVMIPNKRYLRMIYGNLIDKENQRAHNLKCMDLGVFEKFAARKRLDTLHLDYFGGFPYKVHKLLQPWQKLIYYPVRMVSRKLHRTILSNPSALWSGTIIGIFRKASGTEDAPTG